MGNRMSNSALEIIRLELSRNFECCWRLVRECAICAHRDSTSACLCGGGASTDSNGTDSRGRLILLELSLTNISLQAYYSEGMGRVSLQYILCSNAMRMACSKGLHRRPPRSWNTPRHEVRHRNWMFWSIYCLEKQICTRSGRPSVCTLVPSNHEVFA